MKKTMLLILLFPLAWVWQSVKRKALRNAPERRSTRPWKRRAIRWKRPPTMSKRPPTRFNIGKRGQPPNTAFGTVKGPPPANAMRTPLNGDAPSTKSFCVLFAIQLPVICQSVAV